MRYWSALVPAVLLCAGCGSSASSPKDAGNPVSMAGNPNGSCSAGVPSSGQPADVSNPTVIGTGSPASCTFSALESAVSAGGVITFDCGSAATTIPITATMNLPIDKDTVIDGGNKVTLDGRHAVQILNYNSQNFQATETRVTLQHITLVNGKTTPTDMIPAAPRPPARKGTTTARGARSTCATAT